MANLSQVNGKTLATISQIDGKLKTAILQVDGQGVVNNSVAVVGGFYTGSGTTGTVTLGPGTITVTGSSATFSAFATVSSLPKTTTTNITIGGTSRSATASTVGTVVSTTFVLTPGAYAYSGTVALTGGSGFGSGGIQWTQP